MASTPSYTQGVAGLSGEDLTHLYAKQVAVLYDQSIGALAGALLSGLVVAAVLWRRTPSGGVLSWLGILLCVTGFRLALTYRYRRSAVDPQRARPWEAWFISGAFMSGATWGMGAVLLLPQGYDLYTGFFLLWVGGLCAAAVATYSVRIPVFLASVVPALAPYALYALSAGNEQGVALAGMLGLFLGFLVVSALHTHRSLFASLELQFENTKLINHLSAERERAERLNVELQSDIDERERMLETLIDAKQRVEELAQRLQLLSSLDGLTGIANRRHFDDGIDREWRRALRDQTPISLIMVDIDFFKAYNDTYGHQAGDDCLKQVAGLLKRYSRRAGDFPARYGGEEFTVVLSGTGTGNAQRIAEEIREGVESLGIPHESSSAGDVVTVSAGVATVVPHDGLSVAELIRKADSALYRAKGAGRNRVVVDHTLLWGSASSG